MRKSGETSSILSQLAAAGARRIAWIESVVTLNPEVISQFGFSQGAFTFFESGAYGEWVLDEVMSCALFLHVVYVPTQNLLDFKSAELTRQFQDRGLELMILQSHLFRRKALHIGTVAHRLPETNFDLATGF